MYRKAVMENPEKLVDGRGSSHVRHANMLSDWSDFLRKYQHDLQGPLRNIANYLQILKDELANADSIDKSATLKCISAAEYCVYTLNSINISQLLDNYNVIEAFDLEKLLEPLYCLLLSQLNERSCQIDVEPGIPNIMGNKDEILRVFKNLIENSLNHAETKEPLVIRIRKLCQRNDRIMLQFSDNGKTLTERVRKKIRSSFSLPASGLAIVNSLLTKNHGFMQLVKSERGCMWELELPLKPTKVEDTYVTGVGSTDAGSLHSSPKNSGTSKVRSDTLRTDAASAYESISSTKRYGMDSSTSSKNSTIKASVDTRRYTTSTKSSVMSFREQ